jgi:hypothetical protein
MKMPQFIQVANGNAAIYPSRKWKCRNLSKSQMEMPQFIQVENGNAAIYPSQTYT